MKEDKKDGKKKIKVRNLSKTASKELSDKETSQVSGGAKYTCPGDCSTLIVLTARGSRLLVSTACPGGEGDLVTRFPPKK